MSRALKRRAVRLAAAGIVAVGALALSGTAAADPAADRDRVLDASAAWRDVLDAHRAPVWPRPGDSESVVLLLSEPAVGTLPPARRADGLEAVEAEHAALEPVLADLGVTVTLRTRVAANAMAVRLPAGGLEVLGGLPQVRAIVPVSYLAPAQATETTSAPASGDTATPAREPAQARGGDAAAPGVSPVRIALIDAGIDPSHPILGGGMGPTFPILGGVDMVDRDNDPRIDASGVHHEAHGTQMAGLVLGSPLLTDLAPAQRPRLIAHRVVEAEAVAGRLRPLARSDRVLGAIERSVDPNGDGDPRDRVDVILIGLASGFGGNGVDPLTEAVAAADRLGSVVVVPAGNDGATLTRPGSVGTLAAAPAALTVGGTSRDAVARTARLDVQVGPAVAALEPLPLLGAAPNGDTMPVRVLRQGGGVAAGDAAEDYLDESGRSAVQGALAVVSRGGGTLQHKARLAAAAGARALAVWDEPGPAAYPVTAGDLGLSIPVVGLGRVQAAALEELLASGPALSVTVRENPPPPADPEAVASFSSWGPTADGRQKPEVVAPAVAVPAPLPGRGADGLPRSGALTGTSAAAAEVAARAARLRVDRPDLGSAAVRALLVQGARPLAGVASMRQGAGVVGQPAAGPVHIAPAVVHAVTSDDAGGRQRLTLALVDLSGNAGRYTVLLRDRTGEETVMRPAVAVAAGGRTRLDVAVDGAAGDGQVVVRRIGSVDDLVVAPVAAMRPAPTLPNALGRPVVRVSSGFAEVMVRVGQLRREDGRVVSAALRSVRVHLVPSDGGPAIRVLGTRQDGAWPAGTYRLLVSRRGGDGAELPEGAYRVRVTAVAADGTVLRTSSTRFPLR